MASDKAFCYGFGNRDTSERGSLRESKERIDPRSVASRRASFISLPYVGEGQGGWKLVNGTLDASILFDSSLLRRNSMLDI